jgi:hypothetical protein
LFSLLLLAPKGDSTTNVKVDLFNKDDGQKLSTQEIFEYMPMPWHTKGLLGLSTSTKPQERSSLNQFKEVTSLLVHYSMLPVLGPLLHFLTQNVLVKILTP